MVMTILLAFAPHIASQGIWDRLVDISKVDLFLDGDDNLAIEQNNLLFHHVQSFVKESRRFNTSTVLPSAFSIFRSDPHLHLHLHLHLHQTNVNKKTNKYYQSKILM